MPRVEGFVVQQEHVRTDLADLTLADPFGLAVQARQGTADLLVPLLVGKSSSAAVSSRIRFQGPVQ